MNLVVAVSVLIWLALGICLWLLAGRIVREEQFLK
jgi:hypothetical protein